MENQPHPSPNQNLNPYPQYVPANGSYHATPPTQPIPTSVTPRPKKQSGSGYFLLVTMVVIASLVAVTFIGLFIWKWIQWEEVQTNIDRKIESATATAVSENTSALEAEFAEREKDPFNQFSAPEDYGTLEFRYPKTWSVYISQDASHGGDFSAILNPDRIIANESIYALHVQITSDVYEDVIDNYTKYVSEGTATHSTRVVNNITSNVYTGTFDGSYRKILVIKIRDKVAYIWTDAEVYSNDFDRIIDTITYNA